ncbi:MAG TPA: hypothetical protein VNC78_08485 [Actinomycetota bacterium]|nr:hypothetical protein [Actinomycetota bacterium]
MRRMFSAVGLATVVALVPLASQAAQTGQRVEGSVAISATYPDGTCYPGLARRLAIASNGAINGVTGYVFDIDSATWNKRFVLEPTGGQGTVDLDITFYYDFGDLDPSTSPANRTYADRNTAGEKGLVPRTAEKAIVCMFADGGMTPPGGVAATFTYKAGVRR